MSYLLYAYGRYKYLQKLELQNIHLLDVTSFWLPRVTISVYAFNYFHLGNMMWAIGGE